MLVVLVLALAACSGSEDTATDPPEETSAAPVVDATADEPSMTESDTVTEAAAEDELPQFLADFDRVCTTQVGFAGATAYEQTPGLHPMVFFEEFREAGNLLESSREFPAGWAVTEDTNFEDSSELAAVELVGCSLRVAATPNGTMCEFDNDGQTVTLELVDGVYEVTLYEATTGAEVTTVTLEATSTECPFVVSFEEGDTQHFNEPTDDQLIVALQPFVQR